MDYNDGHFHWWHWLIIIAIVVIVLGIGYTWINNYEIVQKDDRGYLNETERVIEHPINATENAVNDIVK